jgi:hypothetical protein
MSVFLYSSTPSYSASGLLGAAFYKSCESATVWFKGRGTEGFDKYCENATFGADQKITQEIKDADQWVFCAGKSYIDFFSRYKDALKLSEGKSVKVILTDSQFCRNYVGWSKIFKRRNVTVFAMPDVSPYCVDIEPLPYYPPVDIVLDDVATKQNDELTICHSPFKKFSNNAKGSAEIVKVIEALKKDYPDLRSEILTDSTREETLQKKAESHIFIDQLVYKNPNVPMLWGSKKYEGAVGKSGCEAMFLNTLVVTGAPEPFFDEKYFPKPPVCWVDANNCEGILRYFIGNPQERADVVVKQKAWAEKYLALSFVANHILSNG